jgi:hypothetical protein
MSRTTDLQKVTFRIPRAVYAAIQEAAEAETRPINSQVIVLLREALAARTSQTAKASEKTV